METLIKHNVPAVARELLDKHGLFNWHFQYDRAKRRAGCCKHSRLTITLSYYFACHNGEAEIRETILHEIAHALAGPREGHGPAWKAICRRIGAKPVRCYNSSVVDMPQGDFKATCNGCQAVFHRHRRPGRGRWRYCTKCGPELGRLEFAR